MTDNTLRHIRTTILAIKITIAHKNKKYTYQCKKKVFVILYTYKGAYVYGYVDLLYGLRPVIYCSIYGLQY